MSRMEAREVLRRRREARSVTQEQLAATIGRKVETVSGYERGLFNPSRQTALAIDEALDADGEIVAAYFPSMTRMDALEGTVTRLAAEVAELQRQVGRLVELQGD